MPAVLDGLVVFDADLGRAKEYHVEADEILEDLDLNNLVQLDLHFEVKDLVREVFGQGLFGEASAVLAKFEHFTNETLFDYQFVRVQRLDFLGDAREFALQHQLHPRAWAA